MLLLYFCFRKNRRDLFTSLAANGQTKESLNLLSIYGHHSFVFEMLKHVVLCCYCFSLLFSLWCYIYHYAFRFGGFFC